MPQVEIILNLLRDLLGYLGPSTEQSILIDLDLQELRKKYLIPEEFQLIAPGGMVGLPNLQKVVSHFMMRHFGLGFDFSYIPFSVMYLISIDSV